MTVRQDQHIIQIITHGWSETGQVLLGLDKDGDVWVADVKLTHNNETSLPVDIRWKLLRSYFSD